MKNKKMAKDGTYSDSIYGKAIDGSNESDERGSPRRDSGKARFLRDAMAILRQTASLLSADGLECGKVSVNRAGSACSGEVSVEFWEKKNPLLRVFVQIGTMPIASLSGREDGVTIMSRVQAYRQEGGRLVRGQSDANQWLSPEMDSGQLVNKVFAILGRKPREVQVHPISEAPIVLPGPFVRSPEEATELVAAYQRAQRSLQAEQGERQTAALPAGQLGLL
jgi:hypothetical protein